MNNYKTPGMIKYISLILVLSYFLLDNIYIVFSGMILSIYTMNEKAIGKILAFAKKSKLINDENRIDGDKKNTLEIVKPEEEKSKLSLVEEIEELGFIPSPKEIINDEVA